MRNTKDSKRVTRGKKLLIDYRAMVALRSEGYDDETIAMILNRKVSYLRKLEATFA